MTTFKSVQSPVVHVEGLGKEYRIGSRRLPYKTLRESLTVMAQAPVRRARNLLRGHAAGDLDKAFWALKDVAFDVQPGEVVGIIGRNGAGKSTLLKLLSRITEPTEGFIELIGRVGALLEVGTGFHPELTGRENVYLNGAILGMSRIEIARKFDEIIEFAEIDQFIDTPVKHYSTGMGLRLGFAVAAYLEPEILIVDEVLAVGDAKFQRKCIGKMSTVAGEGRTVLFVSHNMGAIQSLCQRVLWLDAGRIVNDGPSSTVVGDYLRSTVSAKSSSVWADQHSAPGNDKIRLHSVSVSAESGQVGEQITCHTPIVVQFKYWNLQPKTQIRLSSAVSYQNGVLVFSTRSISDVNWHGHNFPIGLFVSEYRIPGDLLNDGTYHVSLRFMQDESMSIYYDESIITFEVIDTGDPNGQWVGKRNGVIRLNLQWTTNLATNGASHNEQ